jgi:hydrogenase nickel incorporation protein HypA/HybF
MHEQGIAQEMVSAALRYGAENRAQRITQMRIELSQTAHESESSLLLYLEHLARGTMAQDAEFEILRVPVPARCRNCEYKIEPSEFDEVCPRCGSLKIETCTAQEIRLTSIEIE